MTITFPDLFFSVTFISCKVNLRLVPSQNESFCGSPHVCISSAFIIHNSFQYPLMFLSVDVGAIAFYVPILFPWYYSLNNF
jgi:hypothetical protein